MAGIWPPRGMVWTTHSFTSWSATVAAITTNSIRIYTLRSPPVITVVFGDILPFLRGKVKRLHIADLF